MTRTLDLFGEPDPLQVTFNPAWLAQEDADKVLRDLQEEVSWKQDYLATPGGRVAFPRLTAWQGDPGAVYVYSGVRNQPGLWTPTVRELRVRLQEELGVKFNSVLLNLYRTGTDSMGWHSDDEPELGKEPTIASVSLGAVRTFEFRHRREARPIERFELTSGSLVVMHGKCQDDWVHRIPKELKVQGPRINLTFRKVSIKD